MRGHFVTRLLAFVDAEAYRKGWWMLVLIIGTIVALFIVCSVLVARSPAP